MAGAPDHRHHLVCAGVARLFRSTPVRSPIWLTRWRRENDFEVHGHLLEIFGTCGDCRTAVR